MVISLTATKFKFLIFLILNALASITFMLSPCNPLIEDYTNIFYTIEMGIFCLLNVR
jgi:hypothetical protein